MSGWPGVQNCPSTTLLLVSIILCPYEVVAGSRYYKIFIFCEHARNKWAINYKLCLFVSVFYLDWPLIFPRKMPGRDQQNAEKKLLSDPGRPGLYWFTIVTNSVAAPLSLLRSC